MNATQIRLLVAGGFFLFIFLSGVWLTHNGRPYPVWMVTIHKLIALATVVFLALVIYQIHQAVPLDGWRILAVAATGLLMVATIIFGGLATIENASLPAALVTTHRILPFVTVFSCGWMLYLLVIRAA